ncbi:sensor domain-containing diguanylate cyclase [Deinococcus sp. HMF7604]|uniref:sensor domain-containing diguanylate cyclase n=1 Tax=Deinococcus betulae TaxID=2873312 RepID=UPI001CCD8DF2|nr:sensor domain-containing diguanylate cyclase [Deinococcus betulae]MBZ9750223.1 sensor domain-containing diguanylate cyclase [Deinococcus betulae]
MTGAPLPSDEYRRLLDLARYQILDSSPEEDFDRITRLAARVLNTPMAVLNLVDQHRQWGKAVFGMDDSTAPRHDSFCAWTILDDAPMVVENASLDPRFQHNPMVVGDPHIRLYAGAPLTTPAGSRIGSLCVVDSQPRALEPGDVQALQDLATLTMQTLELRRQGLEAQQDANAQRHQAAELRRTLEQARILEGVSSLMDLDLDPGQATLTAASLISEAIEADYTFLLTWPGETFAVHTAYQRPGLPSDTANLAQALPKMGGVTATLRNRREPLYLQDYGAHPQALAAASEVEQVAWVPLGTAGDQTALLMVVRLKGNAVTTWRGGDRTLLEAAARTIRHALQRHAALDQAQQQARRDALTGLSNRRAFDEDLASQWAAGVPLTLALVDLDGLKAINDREGHAQGDKLLQVFGQALAAETTPGRAYRLGGDEFAVLLPGESEDEVLEQIDLAMSAAQAVSVQRTGASTGVVQSGEVDTLQALLALADERMYIAKRRRQKGTNRPPV